jgi:hypothetical protein
MIRHFIFVSADGYLTLNHDQTGIAITTNKQEALVLQLPSAQPAELLGVLWTPEEVSTECKNNPGYFDVD